MTRVLGEIAALVFAVLVSGAALVPAFSVVLAGVRPDPEGAAFLVLGMVYGMVAPIGYFLGETWERRIWYVLAAAAAACGIARTGYLFDVKAPGAAILTFALLVAGFGLATAWNRAADRRRLAAVAAVEAHAAEVVRAVARAGGAASGAGLAERLAGAAVWTAAREARTAEDARRRIGRALAALECDLAANPAIEAAPYAVRLLGEMRVRIAPRRFRQRRPAPRVQPA